MKRVRGAAKQHRDRAQRRYAAYEREFELKKIAEQRPSSAQRGEQQH